MKIKVHKSIWLLGVSAILLLLVLKLGILGIGHGKGSLEVYFSGELPKKVSVYKSDPAPSNLIFTTTNFSEKTRIFPLDYGPYTIGIEWNNGHKTFANFYHHNSWHDEVVKIEKKENQNLIDFKYYAEEKLIFDGEIRIEDISKDTEVYLMSQI